MEPTHPKKAAPSIGLSVAIFVFAVGSMAYLRLHVYSDRFISLTYGLPLLICLWQRDRKLLWSMAVVFSAMSAYKSFFLLPAETASSDWILAQWLMQLINIFVVGGTVHGILNLTDRLRRKNQLLAIANEELAARAEEITRQNDELQSQSEELSQQNEEIQLQSEELAEQNEEMQQQAEELTIQSEEIQQSNVELNLRESLLQNLLDCVRDSGESAVLERICESTLALLGEDARGAGIMEIADGELQVRAFTGEFQPKEKSLKLENSLASVVVRHDRTAFVEDLAQRPDVCVPGSAENCFKSVLATPLRIKGKPVGTVEVYSCSPQKWTSRHFQLLEWLAAQASLILESRRFDEERRQAELSLEKQNQRLRLISEALTYLLSARDGKDLARDLFPRVADHLGVDTYLNFLVDETGERLNLNCCAGVSEEMAREIQSLDFNRSFSGLVASKKEPIIANRIQESTDPRASLARSFGINSYACHPLISGDRVIGTLAFATRDRDQFNEDELEFLKTIAKYVSVAMDRLHTEKQLHSAKMQLEAEVEKRTAKLQEAVGELEHFSYTITHDMRAPLRSMRGFGEILLHESGESLTCEQLDYLGKIVKSADRMDALIRDALNYSKIVREQMRLSVVDAQSLLLDIIQSYPALQPPHAFIEIDGDLPRVLGNEAGLTQCFSNLLNNAVKFVRAGEPARVLIRATAEEGLVRIWFEDNGIGIKKEYHDRLFEMFQRLNRDYEGTGIGLALVRKVTERMGGKVGVESEPGRGSRFWLELQRAGGREP